MKWYVLHVKTGQEIKVRDTLQGRQIIAKVPREIVPTRTGGTWVDKEKTLIPGYVFVGTDDLSHKEYYAALRIPEVMRFLGTPPQAISYLEAEYIGLLTPADGPLQPSVLAVDDKDGVPTVASGLLLNFPGEVVKIDKRRRRAKVRITLLGEPVEIELAVMPEGEPVEVVPSGDELDEST